MHERRRRSDDRPERGAERERIGRPERERVGVGRGAVPHRVLQWRRRRQRLPRGAGLHREAEALASGQVSKLTQIHRNTDAAGQLQDLRDLIAADVDAIVFNPNDPDALSPALDEAKAAGIKTISVDAFVNHADTYNLYNNQIEYAKLGAKWLFDKIGGSGKVWYTRGFAGHPADTDRHTGFNEVLKDYPGIELLPGPEGVHTGWDPATATNLANEFMSSGQWDSISPKRGSRVPL